MGRGAPGVTVVILIGVLLAGCSGASPAGTGTPTATPSPATSATTAQPTTHAVTTTLPSRVPTPGGPTATPNPTVAEGFYQEPTAALRVGTEADLPRSTYGQEYLIWNNASDPRTIAVTVWRTATVVLEERVKLPAEGLLTVSVYKPGVYTVVIDPADLDRVVFRPGALDCNKHWYQIAVPPNGSIAIRHVATLIKCETLTPTTETT